MGREGRRDFGLLVWRQRLIGGLVWVLVYVNGV